MYPRYARFPPNYFLYSFYVGGVIISDLKYEIRRRYSAPLIYGPVLVDANFATREEVYSLPYAMMAHSDIDMNYFFVS